MDTDKQERLDDGWRRLAVAVMYGRTDDGIRRACLGCGAHTIGSLSCSVCGSWALTTVLEAAPTNGHSDARPDLDEGEVLRSLRSDLEAARTARLEARDAAETPRRRATDAAPVTVSVTGERLT